MSFIPVMCVLCSPEPSAQPEECVWASLWPRTVPLGRHISSHLALPSPSFEGCGLPFPLLWGLQFPVRDVLFSGASLGLSAKLLQRALSPAL